MTLTWMTIHTLYADDVDMRIQSKSEYYNAVQDQVRTDSPKHFIRHKIRIANDDNKYHEAETAILYRIPLITTISILSAVYRA